MLRHRGVATRLSAPVSAGLLSDIRGYHAALTSFRDGDPDAIVVLCSAAALRSVANGQVLAEQVHGIIAGWEERQTARRDAAAWQVLPLLARRPVINPDVLKADLGLDYPRQKRAMDALEDAGIVTGVDKFKRGRFWRSPEILSALDDFADRARRARL